MTDLTISQNDNNLALVETWPLDRNPAAVYLATQAPSGRRGQKQALDVIAGMLTGNADCFACNWGAVRFSHASAIRAQLVERYAPKTTNKFLAALRGTIGMAFDLELISGDDYMRIKRVKNVTDDTLPAGRELTAGEIAALFAVCDNDPTAAGPRDAALIACMYPGGLRRDEVRQLDVSDYNQETGKLLVRHGKRSKQRKGRLENGARRAMVDWLAVRGLDPGPLFFPIDRWGHIAPRRMTDQAIYGMLKKRGSEAKIADFSPHDLRRTFVSDLLAAGVDINRVAKMAGHSNVQTTSRYDRRPDAAMDEAATRLHIPYRGRG